MARPGTWFVKGVPTAATLMLVSMREKGRSLRGLGDDFGVSHERIRQVLQAWEAYHRQQGSVVPRLAVE